MDDAKSNKKAAPSVPDREARWKTARMVFETTEMSAQDIAGLMGVTPGTVRTHVKVEGWAKRRPAPAWTGPDDEAATTELVPASTNEAAALGDTPPRSEAKLLNAPGAAADERREDVVSRLHGAIARQVDEIEARFKQRGADGIERDVKALGVLAKTVETLMLIDRRRTDSTAAQDNEVELERARAEIAQRLDRLRAAR